MEIVLAALVAAVVAVIVPAISQRWQRRRVAAERAERGSYPSGGDPERAVASTAALSLPAGDAPPPTGGASGDRRNSGEAAPAGATDAVPAAAAGRVAEAAGTAPERVDGDGAEGRGVEGRPEETATGVSATGPEARGHGRAAADGDPARGGGGARSDRVHGAPAKAAPAEAQEAAEDELRERRAEIARIEERLLGKEKALEARLGEVERRERAAEDRARNLDQSQERLQAAKQEQRRELERIAGLSAGQAKQLLLRELEDELKHDSARLVRQAEEEARREADRRARNILSTAMQRLASGHAAETTVSLVPLKSDDMKGRVIGREGRNIRTLETLTGIDFIIDDTPSAVILSGFDGVRREIARRTLEKLLEDGRIHPARIEEAYHQARSELEEHIVEVGEQAVFEAHAGAVHPELVKLLGRLHYRTSYGQNVLAHSVECARLAGMIAAELGANAKTARRAALMHDIGKAVSHEVEGPHALVGGELARRYGESEAVAHAMEAHHDEVEIQTVEAVIVQVCDALSGARPGARGESLEQYVKRLKDLEQIATRHEGVEKVYAVQAGREVRVIVRPEDVDDDAAALLSRAIASDVERELEYAGQIKVTVIRESRAVDYAK